MPPTRRLGNTDIQVTPVAMGCWPITGITSIDVNEADSLATLQAAVDAGINFFDTAYIYGYEGESERMIARALGHLRDQIVIASKCGLHWDENKKQARDARPETIHRECEESLRRLNTDRIDLYYLHAPDPSVPLAESAGAFRELLEAGKIRSVGVSNLKTVEQFEEFHAVCPITASQPHYNMLQREIEAEQVPWCTEHNIALCVYWPLMKGFLAGKLPRDHVWDPKDGRQKYPRLPGRPVGPHTRLPRQTPPPRRGVRPHTPPTRHRLDHPPARHYRSALRRKETRPDPRHRRRHDRRSRPRDPHRHQPGHHRPRRRLLPRRCDVDNWLRTRIRN